MAVGGAVHIDLDAVGAGGQRGGDGLRRVLQETMARRIDPGGGAGLVVQPFAGVRLVHATVRNPLEVRRLRRCAKRSVQ